MPLKGAELISGGERIRDDSCANGFFYAPTILSRVTPEMLIYREETFGPVAPVIIYQDEDDLLEMANDTHYGLASYVYTQNLKSAMRLFEGLDLELLESMISIQPRRRLPSAESRIAESEEKEHQKGSTNTWKPNSEGFRFNSNEIKSLKDMIPIAFPSLSPTMAIRSGECPIEKGSLQTGMFSCLTCSTVSSTSSTSKNRIVPCSWEGLLDGCLTNAPSRIQEFH